MSVRQLLLGLGLCAAAGLGSGCLHRASHHLSDHVLPVQPSGELGPFEFYEPGVRGRVRPPASTGERTALARQVDNLLDAAERAQESYGASNLRLLIHVHGGRNTYRQSARTADHLITAMNNDIATSEEQGLDVPWFYPLFIQWRSGDFSTAGSRQFAIRQGYDRSGWFGWLTFPFVFSHDVMRGITRLPLSTFYQWLRDGSVALSVWPGVTVPPGWRIARATERALEGATGPVQLRVEPATYERGFLQHAGRFLAYWPTQLTKLPIQALFLEGLGQGAWDAMRRRAAHLIWSPDTFEDDLSGFDSTAFRERVLGARPDGAIPTLVRAIGQRARERQETIEILLVGHSMGCMAINDALDAISDEIDAARPPSETGQSPKPSRVQLTHLLYLAPACSTLHAAETVVPFLEDHPESKFHYLALHPLAEADERNFFDLVPRGSLLEWIDTYYTTPANQPERVFGKWSNAMGSIELFAGVAEQVEFKAFDVVGHSVPQKHGELGRIPFWRPEAYETRTAGPAPAETTPPGSGWGNAFCPDWLARACAGTLP